ncbi:hypothetical protein DMB65_20575 [Flavobacterium cheongpyeongense]|uniref:Zinc-ribbon 15 domain-containing protein n=1 Tax=Flavobacterium cheongpyeongense TaxID=2212651 RepID=A0A2V4BIS3_9FLAO|nr:hypothetical protein [Flavobacterium cheongpyeongense]PXY38858.1 hypothetical protein DMB65_20575 [Flavobacterium cheongpyeongense]
MMILVGVRDSNIKNGTILNEKCPKCNQENSLHFSIYRRYTHLTLIPLFPVGKIVFIDCDHCKETFDYEDLSGNIQLKLRNEKLDATPWMFLGSIVLVVFIIFTISNYFDEKDKTSILIQNPIIGDVYNLKFSNGYYSNMRIDKVTKDSVYTTHNDFEAYMPYEIDDLDKAENFSDQKVYYSRKDILKLYQEDKIIKIRRK